MEGIRVVYKYTYIPRTIALRKCWCGVVNTIETIRHHNGTPVCECGTAIKNPPQDWKKENY